MSARQEKVNESEDFLKNAAALETMDVRQMAEYVSDIALQLRNLAKASEQRFLAHLLELVVLEALETVKHGADYTARTKAKAQSN